MQLSSEIALSSRAAESLSHNQLSYSASGVARGHQIGLR
jgi:hypothetical protein